MKQRLLVMNGQKLVQSEQEGQWVTSKVEKAGSVRPGLYNIYLATLANQCKPYDGVILHVDKAQVVQQVGKSFITHELGKFAKTPVVGSTVSIQYDDDQAIAVAVGLKRGRGISR